MQVYRIRKKTSIYEDTSYSVQWWIGLECTLADLVRVRMGERSFVGFVRARLVRIRVDMQWGM